MQRDPHPRRRRRRHAHRQPARHASSAARSSAGEVDDHGRRRDRPARLPARASCTSPWAASGPRSSSGPSARCSTSGSSSSSARSRRSTRRAQVVDAGRRPAARLRPPRPRDRLADRARGDRALRHRGPPLLHRRGGARAAPRARRVHGRPDRHRHRRDALQVPAGAARGRVPDRVRAPRARPPRQERDPLLLADRARVHDRERVARWPPRSSRRRASSSTRSSTSRRSTRSARSSRASRARSCRTTC